MPGRVIQGPVVTKLPIDRRGQEVVLDAYAYQGPADREQILALVHRSPAVDAGGTPIVRIHSGCVTGDVFQSLRCDCHRQLQLALDAICEAAFGVIVYLPYQEGRGIGLYHKLRAYECQDQGADTIDANIQIGMPIDARDYSLAAWVLRDLGLSTVKLLSGNPLKSEALIASGIKVVQCAPLRSAPNRFNEKYLLTKRQRMAHDL